jgi:hypothetical protein
MVGMNPTQSNLHSTRLENLGLESYGVRFDLDGRTVQIRGDARTPLVGALQSFHRQALEDFQAHQAMPRPGWFSRLRSWFGRLMGATPGEGERSRPAPQPAPEPPRARQAGPLQETGPAPSPSGKKMPSAKAEEPILRSVFADKDGVHLIWQPAARGGRSKEIAMTYNLDSELAGRLQDCYGHLAELGYKVAGLELLRPEGGKGPADGKSPGKSAEAVPPSQPAPGREKGGEAVARPRVPRHRPAPPAEAVRAPEAAAVRPEASPEPG